MANTFIAAPTENDDMETILDTDRCEHGFTSVRQCLLLNMTEISQLIAISFSTTVTQLETESVSMRNQNNQLCYSVSLQILHIVNWGQFECVIHFRHLSDFREEEQRNSVQNCQQSKHLECHPLASEAALFPHEKYQHCSTETGSLKCTLVKHL